MIPSLRLKGPRLRSRLVSFVTETYVESSQQTIQKLNVTIRLPSHTLKEVEEDSYYKKRRQESDEEYENGPQKSEPIDTGPGATFYANREETDELEEEEEDAIIKTSHHVPKIRTKLEEEISELPSSEDELSSLDAELNKALTSSTTTTVSPSVVKHERVSPKKPLHTRSQEGYRPLPINIKPIVEQELSEFNDEDFGTVDKIVFSLKDPLGGSKIKLPVKSCHCIHFECFDYENFCLFNKIPSGVQTLMKKELAKKSFKKLTKDKQSIGRQSIGKQSIAKQSMMARNKITVINQVHIENNSSYTLKFIKPQVPTYKCPLCDIKFPLNDLLISDSFNYFVKSTPKETERVELVEMNRYRIVDDTIRHKSSAAVSNEDIIVLSDIEDDEPLPPPPTHNLTPNPLQTDIINNDNLDDQYDPTQLESTDNLLNDGLDDYFIQLPSISRPNDYRGKGSWDDPVTLD